MEPALVGYLVKVSNLKETMRRNLPIFGATIQSNLVREPNYTDYI